MLNLSFFRCKLPDGLIVGFEFCVFGVFETVLALSHIVSGKECRVTAQLESELLPVCHFFQQAATQGLGCQ